MVSMIETWLQATEREDSVPLEPFVDARSPARLQRPRAPTPNSQAPSFQYPMDIHAQGVATLTRRRARSVKPRSASESSPDPMSPATPPPGSRPQSQKSSHKYDFFTPPLPDPASFPDPYPNLPYNPVPSLSGSASTRSSAYTSPGSIASSSQDYNPVYVAGQDDYDLSTDSNIGVGITSDQVIDPSDRQSYAAKQPSSGSNDQSRWSESYAGSTRSRGSSWATTGLELKEKQSFDWHAVDERDEDGLTTDDEEYDDDLGRPAAIVVVEEGRGQIVHGQGVALNDLTIYSGTTHLLLSSSLTPNALPSFLVDTLPHISSTLLALDISANFLQSLPVSLAHCYNLEELNVASNPLRALPAFLANLTSLKVLIADSAGLQTSSMPPALAALKNIHTLSLRRNRLHSLPAWLAHLPALETLLIDGNPFSGPWKALVDPLTTKIPMTPAYPPNTPAANFAVDDTTDESAPHSAEPATQTFSRDADAEDFTIKYSPYNSINSAPPVPFAQPSPPLSDTSSPPASPPDRPLTRTRTTPSRPSRNKANVALNLAALEPMTKPMPADDEDEARTKATTLRRMRSADELRLALEVDSSLSRSTVVGSQAAQTRYPNVFPQTLNRELEVEEGSGLGQRFGSIPRRRMNRAQTTASMWEASPSATDGEVHSPPARGTWVGDSKDNQSAAPTVKEAGKGKWGFLRKMSMGKLRNEALNSRASDNVPPPPVPISPPKIIRPPPLVSVSEPIVPSLVPLPPSRAGPGDLSPALSQSLSPPPSQTSPFLLAPASPTPRSAKRRSFLPIDIPSPSAGSASLNSLPPPLSLAPPPKRMANAVASNGVDDDRDEHVKSPPSPTPSTPERREANTQARAMRSIMAYLRDLSDLGATKQSSNDSSSSINVSSSTPSFESEDHSHRRRPTIGDRVVSDSSFSSAFSDAKSESTNVESSGEEKKYKDDKGKRAMIVKEIVQTERTYVKGLQELIDIYVVPAATPATVIGNVPVSGKETVVPTSERKIVFNGLESLHSFHKESFLPALEAASAPLLTSGADDSDGQLSYMVSIALANVFLSHAAFMKMYSTYINNFDNSIQRLKQWTESSRKASSVSTTSSSAANMPSPHLEATLAHSVLTTAQKKRIKSYLKRCRVHPRHSQLNLEGYLLLPVQRIPRYRLLLEELVRATPPRSNVYDNPLERALAEIASLAINMNEGKRESESRKKLVFWQSRIRGKFPSPLVQPHRRLIMDGHLMLTRVVRKSLTPCEVVGVGGDKSTVQVECLSPELTPRYLVAILCNDLLVLCKDPSNGTDPNSIVELWAVLRMQTLPQPASIVHGNALRIVDNKAILYFDATSTPDTLTWCRAINLHVPAMKS